MNDKLEAIIQTKKTEVAVLKQKLAGSQGCDLEKILQGELKFVPKKNVHQVLAYGNHIKVIAEIKRRSPARGDFSDIKNPLELAKQYMAGGASAISVLTDSGAFGGSLKDLEAIAQAAETANTPILRKDFLIDPVQIAESIVYGADMILLIVAALGDQLPVMLKAARALNMPALVEVYKQDEIQQAIDAGAEIIGVNNRNLKTFETDTESAFRLAEYLPKSTIKIAASGIFETTLVKQYHEAGYAAVLVGEALVRSENPAEWIAACKK
jgi:indole-3-glycerol phosphate synthase